MYHKSFFLFHMENAIKMKLTLLFYMLRLRKCVNFILLFYFEQKLYLTAYTFQHFGQLLVLPIKVLYLICLAIGT